MKSFHAAVESRREDDSIFRRLAVPHLRNLKGYPEIRETLIKSDYYYKRLLNLKTAVAGPKAAHLAKITAAFEFSVLTLTVPGLRAENFKISCAFNQLHHFGPP
jgi:hypothetical protein